MSNFELQSRGHGRVFKQERIQNSEIFADCEMGGTHLYKNEI